MRGKEAQKCIEIISKRLPLTTAESQLVKLIINDIRLEFDMEGAIQPSIFNNADSESRGGAPPEWCF
jgi:hypothetical protein